MDPVIKRLQPGDEPLAAKTIRTLKAGYPAPAHQPTDDTYVDDFLKNDRNYFIVATDGEEPIGFVLAYELERLDGPQPMMLLYEIEVAKHRRQQGVAKAMIGLLKSLCQERTSMKMWTLTNASNQAAVRTFKSAGGELASEDDLIMFVYSPETFAPNEA